MTSPTATFFVILSMSLSRKLIAKFQKLVKTKCLSNSYWKTFWTLATHSLGVYEPWFKNPTLKWWEEWTGNTELSSIKRKVLKEVQVWTWPDPYLLPIVGFLAYLLISPGYSVVHSTVPGPLTGLPSPCRLLKSTQD